MHLRTSAICTKLNRSERSWLELIELINGKKHQETHLEADFHNWQQKSQFNECLILFNLAKLVLMLMNFICLKKTDQFGLGKIAKN